MCYTDIIRIGKSRCASLAELAGFLDGVIAHGEQSEGIQALLLISSRAWAKQDNQARWSGQFGLKETIAWEIAGEIISS